MYKVKKWEELTPKYQEIVIHFLVEKADELDRKSCSFGADGWGWLEEMEDEKAEAFKSAALKLGFPHEDWWDPPE